MTKLSASSLLVGILMLVSTTVTVQQKLDKPGLLTASEFIIFQDGLKANFPKADYHLEQWAPGWITQDCLDAVKRANLTATDIEVYNVHYDDCVSPWIMCHHKDSPDPAWHFFENFGRIPVHARSHVRTLISLPDTGDHGYYLNGFIALFDTGTASGAGKKVWSYLFLITHEVGHALDFSNAYADKPLSSSQNWKNAYDQDSKVPDTYAQNNLAEDLAQNTVVAAFDLNVPGGLATLPGNRDWSSFHHQYELVKKEQGDAGGLLKPGGKCTQRLENSKVVQVPTSKKMARAMRGMTMMEGKPNVDLAEGLEIIPPPKGSTMGTCLQH